MILQDIYKLLEGVEVHGKELFAYAVVVAEAYADAPMVEDEAVDAWKQIIQSNERLAKRAFRKLDVEYVDKDPYDNVNDVIADITINNHLYVYKTTSEDSHPSWSAHENNVFRAIHDALSHAGGNAKSFQKFLKRYAIKSSKDKRIRKFASLSHNFTVRGEMNSYNAHRQMVPPDLAGVLFTEIVGQICTYFVTGDYTNNKVAILEGFDYVKIGKVYGSRATRMQEVLNDFNDPDLLYVQTKVNGIKLYKNKIRWKMLSKGTGAGKIT